MTKIINDLLQALKKLHKMQTSLVERIVESSWVVAVEENLVEMQNLLVAVEESLVAVEDRH